jgi:hypothetical protein
MAPKRIEVNDLSRNGREGTDESFENFDLEEFTRLIKAETAKDREKAAHVLAEIFRLTARLLRDHGMACQAAIILEEAFSSSRGEGATPTNEK